jgi:hypothetical protein
MTLWDLWSGVDIRLIGSRPSLVFEWVVAVAVARFCRENFVLVAH